jgi:hypothetical protein
MHSLRLYRAEGDGVRFATQCQLAYGEGMTIEAIKEAIAELPEAEKVSLADWLNAQANAAWDRQISADFSEGGAGDALIAEWDAEIASGKSIPLDEFLNAQSHHRNS